nr:MAG TPA: major capsid protein [Caudoviricetes sp.]
MKDKLLKLIQQKETRKQALLTQVESCEDVVQLRSMNAEMDQLNGDIAEMRSMLEALPNEDMDEREQAAQEGAEQRGEMQTILSAILGERAQRGEEEDDAEYREAWALELTGRPLTDEQREVFDATNAEFRAASPLSTENSGALIPKTVTDGIWARAQEGHAFWADVDPLGVPGTVAAIKDDEKGEDAKWYDEATETEDGSESFSQVELVGRELSRCVPVTWKLKRMAIQAFLPYLTKKLGQKAGDALAYGAVRGKGAPGDSESFKPEPLGVITALKKESSTPQVVKVTGQVAYKDLTALMAKLASGYMAGAAIYANNATIWAQLANVVDGTGRPVFIADPSNEGVGRILGRPVKLESALEDGQILLGNPREGYFANLAQDMTITVEDHGKKRYTDYIIYAIADGKPMDNKAFALLEATAAMASVAEQVSSEQDPKASK